MSTCTLNIMDRIGGSWYHNEPLGILCIDFIKAFDSIEHLFIKNCLKFFNFGDQMIKMISTLLNRRVARVMIGNEYTELFITERGTP